MKRNSTRCRKAKLQIRGRTWCAFIWTSRQKYIPEAGIVAFCACEISSCRKIMETAWFRNKINRWLFCKSIFERPKRKFGKFFCDVVDQSLKKEFLMEVYCYYDIVDQSLKKEFSMEVLKQICSFVPNKVFAIILSLRWGDQKFPNSWRFRDEEWISDILDANLVISDPSVRRSTSFLCSRKSL